MFNESEFLIAWGREFHNLGAEHENAPLYTVVRDRGTYSVTFSPDLRFKEWFCDIGVSNLVMYSGVILFNAL